MTGKAGKKRVYYRKYFKCYQISDDFQQNKFSVRTIYPQVTNVTPEFTRTISRVNLWIIVFF